jgi:hypothetical protein
MVRTSDRACDLAWLCHKDHSAVTANILENPDLTVFPMQQKQRHTKEIYRACVPRLGHIGSDADARPGRKPKRLTLFGINRIRGIEHIRQPIRLGDGLQNRA